MLSQQFKLHLKLTSFHVCCKTKRCCSSSAQRMFPLPVENPAHLTCQQPAAGLADKTSHRIMCKLRRHLSCMALDPIKSTPETRISFSTLGWPRQRSCGKHTISQSRRFCFHKRDSDVTQGKQQGAQTGRERWIALVCRCSCHYLSLPAEGDQHTDTLAA